MSAELKPIVMVVEDDDVDIEFVRRGISKRELPYQVHEMRNGQEALNFLRSDQIDAEQKEQLVVFLDINMPGMNGHQFLEELRQDDALKRLIVFVLTTSDHPQDKAMAYDRNVAGYFVKSNIDGLLDTIAVYAENVEFPPLSDS